MLRYILAAVVAVWGVGTWFIIWFVNSDMMLKAQVTRAKLYRWAGLWPFYAVFWLGVLIIEWLFYWGPWQREMKRGNWDYRAARPKR